MLNRFAECEEFQAFSEFLQEGQKIFVLAKNLI
jgi:hypothetical protein